MFLSQHEQERLLIHVAADVAQRRRDRGLRLNYPEATAVITFHRLSDRLTRVMVTYDHQPQGLLEKTNAMLRASRRGVSGDLMRFKAFAEMSPDTTE